MKSDKNLRFGPGVLMIAVLSSAIALTVWSAWSFLPIFRYRRFFHRSTSYYAQIADGCDTILAGHPVSSNDIVYLTPQAVARSAIRLSGDDSSLPNSIRQLSPDFVLVKSNFVSISIPPEREGGFGIIWKRSQMESNLWVLQADNEDEAKIVYREHKP